jgi:5-methylcytosine-specific restriction enzyme B
VSTQEIEKIKSLIVDWAREFGADDRVDFNKPYILRNNTGADALNDNGAYFGFIHPEEEVSGPFHDFSLTIFPSQSIGQPWLVCLGIGSGGFRHDYELATYPGLRRLYSKLIDTEGYCKTDFSDIESNLPRSFTSNQKIQHIRNTIKTYTKVLPVCQIIENPENEKGQKVIKEFVAAYARIRDWPTNQSHREAISRSLYQNSFSAIENDRENVKKLLVERKYVILQGAPGSGKTWLAKQISSDLKAETFFTQFHAETSYSEFISGILPSTNDSDLTYVRSNGVFPQAVEYAKRNPDKKTLLIIDEINRANLSNVLGPIFYLFEHKQTDTNIQIQITPELAISKMPENLMVIATMNTADRSLAVVDFALRRRFAWYTLKPKAIVGLGSRFFINDFIDIQNIFEWHASYSELSLQPGQGYFIAENENEMRDRIKYELLPLIIEYLQEGLLQSAKEDFNQYFLKRIQVSLYE